MFILSIYKSTDLRRCSRYKNRRFYFNAKTSYFDLETVINCGGAYFIFYNLIEIPKFACLQEMDQNICTIWLKMYRAEVRRTPLGHVTLAILFCVIHRPIFLICWRLRKYSI